MLQIAPPESAALLLFALCLCGLAASVSARTMDPLVTILAADFSVAVASAALIVSAYTLPFALGQPLLGPLGDVYGRPRMLKACLWLLAAFLLAASLAPSLDLLFAARFCAGLVAGGIIPACMATIGDTYPPHRRQLAISKFVTVGLLAQVFSASASGALAEMFGWRSVMVASASLAILGAVMATAILRRAAAPPRPFSLQVAAANYASVFRNPKAALCYSTVFLEGVALYGMLPYIAEIMRATKQGGPREAGIIIGALGVGGIVYTSVLALLLRRFERPHFMAAGGVLMTVGPVTLAAGQPWTLVALAFGFTGFGFMLLHNSIQTEVVELAPDARQSAYSLHAFSFFTGQALGPALYGAGFAVLGTAGAMLLGASLMLITGVTISALFARVSPGD
ncbi:MAG: MFS transporter [Beijerinckiaceae bacterium]|nr:MFS transporter [Beijerinckiaceae bacterium]